MESLSATKVNTLFYERAPLGIPPVTVSPLPPPGITEPFPPPPTFPPPSPPAQQPGTEIPEKKKKRRWLWRALAVLLTPVVLLQAYAFIIQAGFTPPRTAYMLQSKDPVIYEYVSLEHISRYVVAAAIAHEDQQLGPRAGAFDWEELMARAEAHRRGEPDPSGSTIPQQLLKNMFLWEERENPTAFRKGLEAALATQFSYTLDDQRMLELYLNYAQFGPGLYGICAASWYYFNTPPWAMYEYHAWQLMGVLPLPDLVRRAPDGGIYLGHDAHLRVKDYVNGAANVWLTRQLAGMGGWRAAVATVGITDTAADNEDRRNNKDACSTMPPSVRDRLAREAVSPPAPPGT